MGNVLTDQAGQRRFSYDGENHLIGVTAPGVASTLSYDPIGRLNHIVTNGTATNFVWDGDDLLLEYDGSGFTLRRFMHGLGDDNPLIWFEGPTMDQPHQVVAISVAAAPPVAGAVNATVAFNSSLTNIPLALSGGAAAVIAVASAPAHGATQVSGIQIAYQPTTSYAGADTVEIEVS